MRSADERAGDSIRRKQLKEKKYREKKFKDKKLSEDFYDPDKALDTELEEELKSIDEDAYDTYDADLEDADQTVVVPETENEPAGETDETGT